MSPTSTAERDAHSYAIPSEARVTHVSLDLAADFDAHVLAGRATLTLEAVPSATTVVLDTHDLVIEGVVDAAGQKLHYELGHEDRILGRPLTITLPSDCHLVTVSYRTSPDAAALQWLTPAQTAGGRHPYLFSQGQAILTRTWIPTQDSPGIRQTYDARIVAPAPLTVVMSAEQLHAGGDAGERRPRARVRVQARQPVPPYLIAIAIGDTRLQAGRARVRASTPSRRSSTGRRGSSPTSRR